LVVSCESKKMYVLWVMHEGVSYREYFREQERASDLGP
jgi:hypothetical protein